MVTPSQGVFSNWGFSLSFASSHSAVPAEHRLQIDNGAQIRTSACLVGQIASRVSDWMRSTPL